MSGRWAYSGRGWILAYSLQALGNEIQEVWPTGGTTDGTIGDAAHRARKSDHNPDENGWVTAKDVHETEEGQGIQLVKALVATRDPRIKYIIHEGQIWRSYSFANHHPVAWQPGVYTGSNQHTNHVHISVYDWSAPHYRAWGIMDQLSPEEGIGMKELIAEIQAALIDAGHDLGGYRPLDDRFPEGADGLMGDRTRLALRAAFSGGLGFTEEHDHPEITRRLDQHQHKVVEPTEWDVVTGVPI